MKISDVLLGGMLFGGGSGGGSGSAQLVDTDFIHFDGTVKVTLPFALMADNMITVDFKPDQYALYMVITGNTQGNFYNHITMYGNEYYLGAGDAGREIHFAGTFNERHVIEFNKNSAIYFDGDRKGDYYPTTYSNIYHTLGYRADNGTPYVGSFYGFKITSVTTGDDICNLVPKHLIITADDLTQHEYGLYDTVNHVFYTDHGMTGGTASVV